MNISARTDYAIRALLTLAAAQANGSGRGVGRRARGGPGLPKKFLEAILLDLRRRGLVSSRRGSAGGYQLAAPAEIIRLGSVRTNTMRCGQGPVR
ncbi:MAG: Rrf2 family transcriptional regulator [Tetrasphaera sp.]